MKAFPIVAITGVAAEENSFVADGKVWVVANLIQHAKDLIPFDLPLAAIYSGPSVWDPITSAYALAKEMRRVLDVDTSYPIILDQDGFIMDGWHRVARALVDRKSTIKAVRFDKTPAADYVKAEK